MPLSAENFIFPSGDLKPEWLNLADDDALNTALTAMIARAEELSATLDPAVYDAIDIELAETNMVNYFFWNAANNIVMFDPADQKREYEASRFSDEQLRFIQAKMLEAKRGIPAELLKQITGNSGYFQAVY